MASVKREVSAGTRKVTRITIKAMEMTESHNSGRGEEISF
jgi:hypothetical protein